MNDIGTLLYGGISVQLLCVAITAGFWFSKDARAFVSIDIAAFLVGLIACLATLLVPVWEIAWRIGIENSGSCLAEAECRSDWIFSAKWIAASLLGLALQLALFFLRRRR